MVCLSDIIFMWDSSTEQKAEYPTACPQIITWINYWEVVFMNDIIGKKFNRLTVLSFHHKEQSYCNNGKKNGFRYFYLCKCNCGNECVVRKNELINYKIISCGCYRKERAYETNFKKDKITDSRLYNIWSKLKNRCLNMSFKFYKNYGGRGIKVCDEWLNNPQSFYDWAIANGYNSNLTIDRIDFNGNYEPSNCRWVDMKTQSNNRRNNHTITLNGVSHTLSEWSSLTGIEQSTIRARLKRGWSEEKALNPIKFTNQYC